jgi:hypothetical protein
MIGAITWSNDRPEVLVVEGAADAALQVGHYRHALRLIHQRTDLAPDDVDTLQSISARRTL